MQAISSPRADLVRDMRDQVVGQSGSFQKLDWQTDRSNDFLVIASLAAFLHEGKAISLTNNQVEKYLIGSEAVPPTLRKDLLHILRIFEAIIDLGTSAFGVDGRVAPIEFVTVGILIHTRKTEWTVHQLSDAIGLMRKKIRKTDKQNIRNNPGVFKKMFNFASGLRPTMLDKAKKGGTVVADLAIQLPKSSKTTKLSVPMAAQRPRQTAKRRRSAIESDSDDSDDETRRPKSAPRLSSNKTLSPTKSLAKRKSSTGTVAVVAGSATPGASLAKKRNVTDPCQAKPLSQGPPSGSSKTRPSISINSKASTSTAPAPASSKTPTLITPCKPAPKTPTTPILPAFRIDKSSVSAQNPAQSGAWQAWHASQRPPVVTTAAPKTPPLTVPTLRRETSCPPVAHMPMSGPSKDPTLIKTERSTTPFISDGPQTAVPEISGKNRLAEFWATKASTATENRSPTVSPAISAFQPRFVSESANQVSMTTRDPRRLAQLSILRQDPTAAAGPNLLNSHHGSLGKIAEPGVAQSLLDSATAASRSTG